MIERGELTDKSCERIAPLLGGPKTKKSRRTGARNAPRLMRRRSRRRLR